MKVKHCWVWFDFDFDEDDAKHRLTAGNLNTNSGRKE